jgi:hypothetical protein
MKRERARDLATSVRRRLLNRTHANGEDFELLLLRHAFERLLYRLSRSAYRDQFVLKWAMLFPVWNEQPHRPTRDLDLLGHGKASVERLEAIFRDVCAAPVDDDGVFFDPSLVRASVIKEGQDYEGVRVEFPAAIGTARLQMQIDIGYGDVIMPAATEATYPTLLDFPAPVLRVYPKETVVAEKYQAMVALGRTNSRMKDFYDIWTLCRSFEFDGPTLADAIRATFERRGTAVPAAPPDALTTAFAEDETKVRQWQAFLRRGRLTAGTPDLGTVVATLNGFLMPPTLALRNGGAFATTWPAGGPWRFLDSERATAGP